MGLLNLIDHGDWNYYENQRKQALGILGQAATPNTSAQGPVIPQQGSGLLGGEDPRIAAAKLYAMEGQQFDPLASQIGSSFNAAQQSQYKAMIDRSQKEWEANQPTTMQRNVSRYTPGMTPDQQNQFGRDVMLKPQTVIQQGSQLPTQAEAKALTQQEIALDMGSDLERLMLDDSNFLGPTGKFMADLQKAPLIGDILQRYDPISTGQAEVLALTENLSNMILAAVRGAQVGPKEQDRFERQLPTVGMSKQQFKANFDLTMKNLRDLNKGIVSKRKLDVPSASMGSTSPPAGFTEQF